MTLGFVLWRTALFTLLWVVLVEGDPAYFWYAALAVPVAVTASLVWLPRDGSVSSGPGVRDDGGGVRTRPHVGGGEWLRRVAAAARLLAWLLWQSVRGGVDVARRALSRPVRADPVDVIVPVRLRGGVRAASLAVFGLLPGTIVSAVREHDAVVHTLSARIDSAATWRELERRVQAVLGEPDADQ